MVGGCGKCEGSGESYLLETMKTVLIFYRVAKWIVSSFVHGEAGNLPTVRTEKIHPRLMKHHNSLPEKGDSVWDVTEERGADIVK